MADLPRIDRRTTLKWVLAASTTLPLLGPALRAAEAGTLAPLPPAAGYGRDPDLLKTYRPGELWPLVLTAEQRRTAGALADVIIPADEFSPAASAVGVVDFIDEWVSAPYPAQQADRALFVQGLADLERRSLAAFGRGFSTLAAAEHRTLCDPICSTAKAAADLAGAAKFFARFRDVTAGGFYTSPEGTKDLGFVGNVPSVEFEGPSPEVLRQAGLT
jgi:hypothetical protein